MCILYLYSICTIFLSVISLYLTVNIAADANVTITTSITTVKYERENSSSGSIDLFMLFMLVNLMTLVTWDNQY